MKNSYKLLILKNNDRIKDLTSNFSKIQTQFPRIFPAKHFSRKLQHTKKDHIIDKHVKKINRESFRVGLTRAQSRYATTFVYDLIIE